MGIYDIYGNVQIKIGNVEMNCYKIGEKVHLSDGIYVGHEGIVVIIYGKFAAEFEILYSKWGDEITPEQILRPHDEVLREIENFERKNLG